jgi:hypothetical protein
MGKSDPKTKYGKAFVPTIQPTGKKDRRRSSVEAVNSLGMEGRDARLD